MRYKIKHGEADEFRVYRKFSYRPNSLGLRGFLATTFAAIAIFLLIPLPDEILVVPALAKGFQHLLQIEFARAATYAYLFYKSIGIIFLILAVILGGSILLERFKKKVRDRVERSLKSI